MIVRDAKDSLLEKAAWIVADLIQELLEGQERVVLAVPGGRSAAKVFDYLQQQHVDWNRVHIFMVDERRVPLDDPESNFLLVQKHLLFDGIPQENVHPYRHDSGALVYAEELEKFGGVFDVVFLSSGEDGHIAGLYPNHHSISDEGLFIEMDDSPKAPPLRMSASKELLSKTRAGIILFIGELKQEALSSFLDDEGTVEQCPARIVREWNKYFCLTDQEVS